MFGGGAMEFLSSNEKFRQRKFQFLFYLIHCDDLRVTYFRSIEYPVHLYNRNRISLWIGSWEYICVFPVSWNLWIIRDFTRSSDVRYVEKNRGCKSERVKQILRYRVQIKYFKIRISYRDRLFRQFMIYIHIHIYTNRMPTGINHTPT